MNYIPNLSAKALAGKVLSSIGVVLPENRSNTYALIMNSIESELRSTKYSLIMSTTNFNLDAEVALLNLLCSRAVDSILLVGCINEGIGVRLIMDKIDADKPVMTSKLILKPDLIIRSTA